MTYTAIARAKRLAVQVGETRALATAAANRRVLKRFSRLAERLATPADETEHLGAG